MLPTTPLQPADSPRRLERGAALNLLQSLHRHLHPEALLDELWQQAAALSGATGLHYRHTGHGLDIDRGHGAHAASYVLGDQGGELGELTLRFQQRLNEGLLATVEDLLALAMPALRNALAHHQACISAAPEPAGEDAAGSDDALVLVSLDGFGQIRSEHGKTWAQTLIQTISEQIDEGLRDADSVFQIEEGLLAVLLPRTSEPAAVDVAGKIRVLIAGLHLRDGRLAGQLTACMGVAGARDAQSPEDVVHRARAALTRAQREGASTIRATSGP